MASAQISLMMPPVIDCMNIPVAFGRRLIPQLNEHMNDECLPVRQKALSVLGDYVHSAEYAFEAIQKGLVGTLCCLLSDCDAYVRYKSADIFVSIASHSVGRIAMVKKQVHRKIARLLDDEQDAVRFAASHALSKLSETQQGAHAIVEAKLVKVLVDNIKEERKEIQYQLLTALHTCSRVIPVSTIDYGLIEILVDLLDSKEEQLREICCRLILDVGICLKGKRTEVQNELLVRKLVLLLADPDAGVCAAATSCLMNIAITTPGKYMLLKQDALYPLFKLLGSEFSDITLYATKALTLLAETPEGKENLQIKLKCVSPEEWEKVLDPKVLGMDSLPNKRAKYISRKVIYKEV